MNQGLGPHAHTFLFPLLFLLVRLGDDELSSDVISEHMPLSIVHDEEGRRVELLYRLSPTNYVHYIVFSLTLSISFLSHYRHSLKSPVWKRNLVSPSLICHPSSSYVRLNPSK